MSGAELKWRRGRMAGVYVAQGRSRWVVSMVEAASSRKSRLRAKGWILYRDGVRMYDGRMFSTCSMAKWEAQACESRIAAFRLAERTDQ